MTDAMLDTEFLLLDTHTWIWLLITAEPLQSSPALPQVEQALLHDRVYVATISLWEISMLEAKGRVSFPSDCLSWLQKAVDLQGISLVSLTPEIAVLSNRLPGNFHDDPADRIIVATALQTKARLVTRDSKILRYSQTSALKVVEI